MSGFGDQLREAREARGLSLEDVAAATRIVVRHLEALEQGDIEALPAGPFAKGYIDAYAQFLGIDAGPILEAYHAVGRRRGLDVSETRDRVFEEFSQIVGQRTGTTAGPGGRKTLSLVIVAIVAIVAIVVIGGWLVARGRTTDDPVVAPPPAPASSGVADEPEAPPRSAETSRRNDSEMPPETASPREVERVTTPPPVARATPEPPASRANPNIEISDAGIGTGVESHRLVGGGERFPEGSEVVFWTRVVGGEAGNVIHHVWLHEGRGIARIPLTIGGPTWRTYSRRPLPPGAAGRWVAEARGFDGRVLARQEFLCVPTEP